MDITVKAAAEVARRERTASKAMAALIESRSLSIREDEPTYPHALAALAWRIADAMATERGIRATHHGKGTR